MKLNVVGHWNDVVRNTDFVAQEAIAYLVMYSGTVYDHVDITVSAHDNEMSAYYTITKPEVNRAGFLMVAVWHADERRYSYHT